MELSDQQVFHTQFGEGRIVGLDGSFITIRFQSGEKKFLFPDAFESYLTMTDKNAAASVYRLLRGIAEEEDLKRKEELLLARRKTILKSMRLHPRSQAAFRCEAYDRVKLFKEWRVFTGTVKTGYYQGQPNRPARLHQNSACLLTSKGPGMEEKGRYIFGVYMVEENFIGTLCSDGYVPAHSELKLRLSAKEAEPLLFWRYYYNQRYPDAISWDTGEYRYFDNARMARILKDIARIKEKSAESELAERFLRHFCKMNQIEEDAIPESDGALLHI